MNEMENHDEVYVGVMDQCLGDQLDARRRLRTPSQVTSVEDPACPFTVQQSFPNLPYKVVGSHPLRRTSQIISILFWII
jgi:hypothetical protein